MTIQGKQVRLGTPQVKVADMTAGELQTMIETLIDRKMSEWIGDPDVGLDLRPEIIASIERQRQEYVAGVRGKSLKDLAPQFEAH